MKIAEKKKKHLASLFFSSNKWMIYSISAGRETGSMEESCSASKCAAVCMQLCGNVRQFR